MPNKDIERNEVFEFQYWNDTNPFANDIDLTFKVDENKSSIGNLHSMCKTFAKALGYSDELIEEVFGEDYDDRI